MKKTAVLCAVGLTPDLVGEHTPRLAAFARRGAAVPVGGITPAVTTTVQTTYLTGATPAEHGAEAAPDPHGADPRDGGRAGTGPGPLRVDALTGRRPAPVPGRRP